MLIQAGSIEMLLSDSVDAAAKARNQGVKVRLSVYEGMFHVFQMGYLNFPESKRAWAEVKKKKKIEEKQIMITGELRNKIDKIWETFWTGGITNPLDVIEQFTYLLFIKQLDEVETTKENEANFLGVDYESMFPGECQKYRWSKFKNLGSAEEMYELVLNGVFPFIKNLHQDGDSVLCQIYGRCYIQDSHRGNAVKNSRWNR